MKTKKKKLTDFALNKENPFAQQALVNIGHALVTKSVKGTNKDESAVLKGVDHNGEVLGDTVFIRNKTVDSEEFTKFFLAGFKAFFDLKPASMKVFSFILAQLKPNQDCFWFFVEDCMEYTGYSSVSIFRALGELCAAQIIARGRTERLYYINPMVCFNGDRVTFATTYINKNFPSMEGKVTNRNLKGTIDIMKRKGELPYIDKEEDDRVDLTELQAQVDAANRQIIDQVNGEEEDPRQMHLDFDNI